MFLLRINKKQIFLLLVLATAFSGGCSLIPYVFKRTYRVPTESMLPTIKVGDYVHVNESYYLSNPVERFDIVLIRNPNPQTPSEEDWLFVERVIALGGEKVEIRAGKVYINDRELREPYSVIPPETDYGPLIVPQGHYFFMGDNRPNSADSRYWRQPTVDIGYFRGKVINIIRN